MKDLLFLAKKIKQPEYYKTHISYHAVEAGFIIYCLKVLKISHTELALICVNLCIDENAIPNMQACGEPNRTYSIGISAKYKDFIKIKRYCKQQDIVRQNKYIRNCVLKKLVENYTDLTQLKKHCPSTERLPKVRDQLRFLVPM